jgi:glucose-6-phosphate 1-epimerase
VIAPSRRRGALEVVPLTGAGGAQAVVCLQGAHVISWIPAGESADRLFLGGNAVFREGEEVWGGIPVVFPQFGDGPLPLHGFARRLPWRLSGPGLDRCVLTLTESGQTRALWPHRFQLDLHVKVGGPALEVALVVRNTDGAPWEFGAALHTYLAVDATRATLFGLAGAGYLDKDRGFAAFTQPDESFVLAGPHDRVYRDAHYQLGVRDGDRRLGIAAGGFPDVVVWNPGPEGEKRWPGFAPGDWARMACVEAALVGPRRLEPGAVFHGVQRFEAA